MRLDFTRTFKMFEEEDSTQKLLAGGAFYLISVIILGLIGFTVFAFGLTGAVNRENIASIAVTGVIFTLILFFVGAIITAFPVGFALYASHNQIKDRPHVLPVWKSNMKNFFDHGLIYLFITFLYKFAIIASCVVPFVILFLVFSVLNLQFFIPIAAVIVVLLFIVLLMGYLVLMPFIATIYSEDFDFVEAFNINKIIKSFWTAAPEYLISYAVTLVLLLFIVPSIIGLLSLTVVGVILIPFLTLPAHLIILDLFAQTYRISLNKGPESKETNEQASNGA